MGYIIIAMEEQMGRCGTHDVFLSLAMYLGNKTHIDMEHSIDDRWL